MGSGCPLSDRSLTAGARMHAGGDGMQQANEIRFDGWTLKRDSGELLRDGRTVRLRGQSQHVLEALLERPGEVVTRDELIARLWPKGIVDFDTALNSAVRRLRSALDDDAETPRHIETLPRRGYRFIGSIATDGAETHGPSVPPPQRVSGARHWRIAALAVAATLAVAGGASTQIGRDVAQRAARPADLRDSSNPQAMEQYRLARYFLQRTDAGDLERARTHFERAVAVDGTFADAYAGLASAYWRLSVEGLLPRDTGMARMRAAAERALVLAPDLAEAHVRLAYYAGMTSDGHFEEHADRARRAEPENALVLADHSTDALSDGRIDEGIELARRAAAAEPLSSAYRYNFAAALFIAGRFEEAKQVNLDQIEIDPHATTDVAAQVLVLDGQFDEALKLAQAWPDAAFKYEIEALAYYGLHRIDESDAALAKLVDAARESDPLRMVEVYAYRGETDRAFGWLAAGSDWFERGNQPHPSPCVVPWTLRRSPFTASLHGDARWQNWVARAGNT